MLLADHELAASTLAARVAASTWADPYLVVLAGMSAAGGPLHGGASRAVRALLAELRGGIPADTAIAERLRQANTVPGTGHPVYEGPDPRCVVLLAAIQRLRPPKDLRAAMAAILSYTDRRGTHPNVDFALGSFTEEAEMVPDAGEAIYLIARSAAGSPTRSRSTSTVCASAPAPCTPAPRRRTETARLPVLGTLRSK